ncbi:YebC/PmpR family DNA-binding transcriptional regulator, partial [Listeria monocytogenes]|nr:YebC/PmpR family DNA-binding transcriptional regulator [Listeria monocytogenes]
TVDEEEFMLEAIEAGAEDVEVSEDVFEIFTDTATFSEVKEALQEAGYTFATAELTMFPKVYNEIAENNQTQFDKML